MITEMSIEGIAIGLCPIAQRGRLGRRDQERAAVDALVARFCGAGAELRHDADGAPLIEGWHVSVSHSRTTAVIALSRDRRIGVDIEENRRDMLRRVAPKFLAEEEMAAIGDLQLAWTIKEAVYKAAGIKMLSMRDGISIAPDCSWAMAGGVRYELRSVRVGEAWLTLALA